MESSGTGEGREPSFEVSADPGTASEDPRFESLNVCRIAGISTLLIADPTLLLGIATELEEMGFTPTLTTGHRTWWQPSIDLLGEIDANALREDRAVHWFRSQRALSHSAGLAFLVKSLGSASERESSAAAAAIWLLIVRSRPERGETYPLTFNWLPGLPPERWAWPAESEVRERGLNPWDPALWRAIFDVQLREAEGPIARVQALALLSWWRLSLALRSTDPITVSLASAAGFNSNFPFSELPAEESPPRPSEGPRGGGEATSSIIHGTHAWLGPWWRPEGGFHRFIQANHRPNLYSGGAKFSWSGDLSAAHRNRAAVDFCEWSEEMAPEGLRTVFGHSYGGEIGAIAALRGANIEELILLSTPVFEPVLAAARSGIPIVDVRLWFDPVLAFAGSRQALPAGLQVTRVQLKRRTLDHSATHKERVWVEEDIARRGGI